MVPVQGFEPQFLRPERNVLPLDETGIKTHLYGKFF
jgi:hypothetical protein